MPFWMPTIKRSTRRASFSDGLHSGALTSHANICERILSDAGTVGCVHRSGSLNGVLSFFAALFICISRDTIDPGLVGVSLSFVLAIGGFLGFLLQMVTELENKMNAVERYGLLTDRLIHVASMSQTCVVCVRACVQRESLLDGYPE